MRPGVRWPRPAVVITFVLCSVAQPVLRAQGSQSPQTATIEEPAPPSLLQPFLDSLADLRRLPSWNNAMWLGTGLGFAAASHPADRTVSREFAATRTQTFKPGAILGGTPLELGTSFAMYAIGRATNNPRVMRLGSDLIRAQLVAEVVTFGLKQSVRRSRPDGDAFSFPSGHTAVTFASASMLHRHFGWKTGLAAYAVASYVAASRVQMKRHYLSDVAFGAAIGLVAGRTVTLGKLGVTPSAMPRGAGITFTWLGDARHRGLRPK